MENGDLNETVIREYLLGRLDNSEDLSARIDEQALTDPELSETVAVVEDEIIEEYLERTLNADDREACERHFLRPPERKQKLRNARLLNRHLATLSSHSVDVADREGGRQAPSRVARVLPFSRVRNYAEIAAAVLFAVSIAYFVRVHSELKDELGQGRRQLAQEREQNAQLNRRLEAAPEPAKSPTATLSLLEVGTLRGDAHLPELRIGPGAGSIHTEVALPPGAAGTYAVQILCAGRTAWSHGPIDSLGIKNGAILTFDFPGQVLSEGDCKLALRHVSNDEISYLFLVSKLQ